MRLSRGVVFLSIAVWTALPAAAQICTTGSRYGVIPNFRSTGYTAGVSYGLAWDPPAGAPAGMQYDVMVAGTSAGGCVDTSGTGATVMTTTDTQATVSLAQRDRYVLIWVQEHDDACARTNFFYGADTYTTAPQKPPTPTVTVSGNSVKIVVSGYNDPHAPVVYVERITSDGKARIIYGVGNCLTGPLTFTDSGYDLGGSLPPGVYQYRVRVSNFVSPPIYSDSVTVTVGAPQPFAITSFTGSPTTIRPGQAATLSWTTTGASSVLIDNGVGTVATAGSVTVKPTTTTTYKLTAMLGGTTLTETVTIEVLTAPVINVTAFPTAMLQQAGSGGATTSYALTNSGGAAATVTLSQSGTFFTQSPASFTIAPGGTQVITIAGTPQSAGSYDGASILSGAGVPSGLQIPVKLLSAAPPTGSVTADPSANRVDVAAAQGTNPTGSVDFTNRGTAALVGILSSDVPWIIPQSGVVRIDPGQTVTLTFTIDRTKRPDASTLIGSAEGSLSLNFLSGSGSAFAKRPLDTNPSVPSVSLVKVVDTVQPAVSVGGIPALAAGEVALFVSGVGHTIGSKGALFVSDVAMLNPQGSKSIDDVKMYYTALSGTAAAAKSASLPSVPGQVTVAVADVVKNVFSGSDEVGTLQIRSKDADKLAVSATVLTANNPSGTFGNAIPVLRSDRSVAANGTIVLTGLRKDATTHTNLYVQETAGAAATFTTEFLAADGSTAGTQTTQSLDAFKMLRFFDVVPANAVAAILTNTSTAGGKLAAYATPVDQASSDTWAIADWSAQLGYAPTDAAIIPVAGSVHGANNTFYRTDVAITNRGAASGSATLTYVTRTGQKIDHQISLGARQTTVLSDAVGTFFNVTGDSAGYLLFTPVTGSFAVSSRTFTTIGGKPDTFGTGVPALAASSALANGGSRDIAGLSDATRSTVIAGRPGTFRTNFALMETTGKTVTVRVTFRFTFPAGAKAQGVGAASRDYALNANQFLLLNSIAGEILGAARLQFGDLTNVEADFQVISGQGAVVLFTSSVDNGTGDSIVRTD